MHSHVTPAAVASLKASFFESGGDSVLAILVTAKAAELGMHFRVADMFRPRMSAGNECPM